MTKLHCPIAFTTRNFGQYVYYDCLLTSGDVIKFEINLIFFIKLFCYMTKRSRQNLKYLKKEKNT